MAIAGPDVLAPVFTSADRGHTWKQSSLEQKWQLVSISGSGNYIAASSFEIISSTKNKDDDFTITTSYKYSVYVSIDQGNSFVLSDAPSDSVHEWNSINFNYVGDIAYASYTYSDDYSRLYTSINGGYNWTELANSPSLSWSSVMCSSSGQNVTAISHNTNNKYFVYASHDYGNSWTKVLETSTLLGFATTAASGKIIAVIGQACSPTCVPAIFVSLNYGKSWKSTQSSSWNNYGAGITSSSSGLYMAAIGMISGYVSTSCDYGQTWTTQSSNSASMTYSSIAYSGNGQYLFAGLSSSAVAVVIGANTSSAHIPLNVITSSPTMTSAPTASTITPSKAPSYVAYSWNPSLEINYIQNGEFQVQCSASGQYIIAIAGNYIVSPIYTSSNNGTTWVASSIQKQWEIICISGSGKVMAASSYERNEIVTTDDFQTDYSIRYYIYVSTNYGNTWTRSNAPSANTWSSIASNYQGSILIASTSVINSQLLQSTNGGLNWTVISTSPSQSWNSIVVSLVGQNVTALTYSNNSNSYMIYTSSNYGSGWNKVLETTNYLGYLTVSSSGKIIAVTGESCTPTCGPAILLSMDFGKNFKSIKSSSWNNYGAGITSSSSGLYMAAIGMISGYVSTSCDYGQTWTTQSSNSASMTYSSIAYSGNGQYLFAGLSSSAVAVVIGANTSSAHIPLNVITSSPTMTSAPTASTITPSKAPSYVAYSWNPSLEINYIQNGEFQVQCSASGQYIIAIGGQAISGAIYYSSDFGNSWSSGSIMRNWVSIGISSLGEFMAASSVETSVAKLAGDDDFSSQTISNYYLYVSLDFGHSWVKSNAVSSAKWNSITYYSDKVYAVNDDSAGSVYESVNNGLNWTAVASNVDSVHWLTIVSSTSGTNFTALATDDSSYYFVYTSNNFGVIWTKVLDTTSALTTLTASATGKIIAILGESCNPYCSPAILISHNFGKSWKSVESPYWNNYGTTITSSSSGRYMAAIGMIDGYVITSVDYGQTWSTQSSNAAAITYSGIAYSGNGQYLFVGLSGSRVSVAIGSNQTTSTPSASPTTYTSPYVSGYIFTMSFASQSCSGTPVSLFGDSLGDCVVDTQYSSHKYLINKGEYHLSFIFTI